MASAKELRAGARNTLRGRWWPAVAVSLVAAILGYSNVPSPLVVVQNVEEFYPGTFPSFITSLSVGTGIWSFITILIAGAVMLGVSQYYSRLNLGQDVPFETLFKGFQHFGKALGLYLLMTLYILLWGLLFIIPGIVASYRYAMAPYLMAEHPELSPSEAIARSKELMAGKKGDLFFLHLTFIGWAFLAVFTLGIGYLFLAPYMSAAEAGFYLHITGRPYGLGKGHQFTHTSDAPPAGA